MWQNGEYVPETNAEYYCPNCGNETDLPHKIPGDWNDYCPNCYHKLKKTKDR